MELWQEIYSKAMEQKEGREIDFKTVLESACYVALTKIRTVIQNKDLTDSECFFEIEDIVCILEDLGSSGGFRHDFG